jgi:hypothetical protein
MDLIQNTSIKRAGHKSGLGFAKPEASSNLSISWSHQINELKNVTSCFLKNYELCFLKHQKKKKKQDATGLGEIELKDIPATELHLVHLS